MNIVVYTDIIYDLFVYTHTAICKYQRHIYTHEIHRRNFTIARGVYMSVLTRQSVREERERGMIRSLKIQNIKEWGMMEEMKLQDNWVHE